MTKAPEQIAAEEWGPWFPGWNENPDDRILRPSFGIWDRIQYRRQEKPDFIYDGTATQAKWSVGCDYRFRAEHDFYCTGHPLLAILQAQAAPE